MVKWLPKVMPIGIISAHVQVGFGSGAIFGNVGNVGGLGDGALNNCLDPRLKYYIKNQFRNRYYIIVLHINLLFQMCPSQGQNFIHIVRKCLVAAHELERCILHGRFKSFIRYFYNTLKYFSTIYHGHH